MEVLSKYILLFEEWCKAQDPINIILNCIVGIMTIVIAFIILKITLGMITVIFQDEKKNKE